MAQRLQVVTSPVTETPAPDAGFTLGIREVETYLLGIARDITEPLQITLVPKNATSNG